MQNKLLECHILRNYAPSSLNHDEHGSIKTARFGGYERARISSQALKRTVQDFSRENFRSEEHLRQTRRLLRRIVERLAERHDRGEATVWAKTALAALGFVTVGKGHTEYMIRYTPTELEKLANLIEANREALAQAAPHLEKVEGEMLSKKEKDKLKKTVREVVPQEVVKALEEILRTTSSGELALFGRRLADLPEGQVDGALQMSHALSTNRLFREIDFFSAVDDDLVPAERGAGMIGEVEFASSCFYQYACVDLRQLYDNLGGDEEEAMRAVNLFLQAMIFATPKAARRAFAQNNEPGFIAMVVHKNSLPVNFCNAFLEPVDFGDGTSNPLRRSVHHLEAHWQGIKTFYGTFYRPELEVYSSMPGYELKQLEIIKEASLDRLIQTTRNGISQVWQS